METSARNKQMRPFHLLIVAAGSGDRTGANIPKQYLKIGGRSVLQHTIDAFFTLDELYSITVVINEAHQEMFQNKITEGQNIKPVVGGVSRKDSVFNGLKSLSNLKSDEIVLVHDAARPFVCHDEIHDLLASLENHDAATLACPVSDSLRRGNDIVDRNGLWAVQTPQAFRYGTIMEAHKQADATVEHTDDASLVSAMGVDVALVQASRQNFKITDAADITLARKMIEGHRDMSFVSTGTGFDVHAFAAPEEKRALMLCGVHVPHDRGLSGHSDADVGLHAVTDALLGALGEGDIGDHFPPTDSQWEGKDSAHFLEHVLDMLSSRGGQINNIDVTLICEEPKLFAYKASMKERIAAICSLDAIRVNVKATTTEKLGFTGRKEGIAAQAVVTISLPDGR